MELLTEHFILEEREPCTVVHLVSADGMNRLTRERVRALTELFSDDLPSHMTSGHQHHRAVIIAGNQDFFSAGADLNEIALLDVSEGFEFAKMGQKLMRLVDDFPAPTYAAVSGYCLGGGLDLALACDFRICAASAVFGHRGAALGLITGWGGTQRLSRLLGKARAREMFVTAEKLGTAEALDAGLVSEIAPDPLARCIELVGTISAGD